MTFENAVVGGAIPKEYINQSIMVLEKLLRSGIIAGYPTINFKIKLS